MDAATAWGLASPASWTRHTLAHPRAAALLLAGVLALAAWGATRLDTEAGYRALLGADHTAVVELDALAARFGSGLPMAAVFWCDDPARCGDALAPASLEMAYALARSLAAHPGVVRVDSPATTPLWRRPALGLPERHVLVDPTTGRVSHPNDALRSAALEDESWVGHLVSADAQTGALVVHLASSDSERNRGVVERALEASEPWEAEGYRFAWVGGPLEFVVAGDELARATGQMVPAMVVLTALGLWVWFRRLGPALAALAGVGAALLLTLGAQGAWGWPQTSLSQALPPLVLVIGVCDAIHLLHRYTARLSPGDDRAARRAALEAAALGVGTPCALTTLTTAVGFLAFGVAELESVVRFGFSAAWGVAAALVTTFTLTPLLALAMPERAMHSPPAQRRSVEGLAAIARVATERRGLVVGTAALLSLAAAIGLPRLETEARFEDLYGERSRVVQWVDDAAQRLRGAETLEVALHLPAGQTPGDPAALALLAKSEALLARPPLGAVLSLRTPMRTAQRLLHGEALAAGESAAPEREASLARLVRARAPALYPTWVAEADAETPAAFRLSAQSGKLAQRDLRALLDGLRGDFAALLPAGAEVSLSGPLAVVSTMIDALRRAQLASFALAAVAVFALVCALLRSVLRGALAMLPATLPALVTLGVMGWGDVPLDVGSAMVATVLLGVAVDDAVHFLFGYGQARRAGRPPRAALTQTVAEVGGALVATSGALALGFGALALSPWAAVARFGAIAAVALVVALVATVMLLPALLAREEHA